MRAAWLAGSAAAGFQALRHGGELIAVAGIAAFAAERATSGRRWARDRATLLARCERLESNADHDSLTGLMSRASFHAALRTLGSDWPRPSGDSETAPPATPMVLVLFLDLDGFKAINDTFGHRMGDELLVAIAARASAALGDAALLARLGGDEFAAVIPWTCDRLPESYGNAMVAAIVEPLEIGGRRVEVGASVGLAIGDPSTIAGDELLRRADIAMYAAKSAGGARSCVFDDALDQRSLLESAVRAEVGRAMMEDAFQLHYQPIVDARTGALECVEGLIRAQSFNLRDISPATLIATAEASGQIVPLTEWTLDVAMQTILRLGSTPVAVNISPVYFRRPEFVPAIFDKLLGSGVPPEMLVLEVTEGVLIENLDGARESLARLRQVGVRVHLDDFGTGYSSLGYLQHFELDGLKLDKSFLRAAGDKRRVNQIIRSMIDFAHSLDLKVVSEGVETEAQARFLQLLGCDLLQGYGIGMPMPLDKLVALRTGHAAWARPASDTEMALGPQPLVAA